MRKLAIIALITAAFIGLSACSTEESEVVVEMDQGNITQQEFYEELRSIYGEDVLYNMVYLSILEDKYDIDEDFLDEQIELMKEQFGDSLNMVLQQNGFQSIEDYHSTLRLRMFETEAIIDGVEVTDEEINTRYERLATTLEASHILVEDEELANDLYQELLDGADFAELAEEHSDDSSSARGGDLGNFTAGDMVKEFEDKAYSLDVDEISEPVQSEFGWHIIKVTNIEESEQELQPLEDIRDSLETEIAMSKVNQEEAVSKFQSLLKDANIKVNIDDYKDLFEFNSAADASDDE